MCRVWRGLNKRAAWCGVWLGFWVLLPWGAGAWGAKPRCENLLTLPTGIVVRVKDRGHPVTLAAIHGGNIEYFTSAIAQKLAEALGGNFYAYECKRSHGCWEFHVGSSRFREPLFVSLAKRSQWVVAVHGFKESTKRQVVLGGRNKALLSCAWGVLGGLDFLDQSQPNPVSRYWGKSKHNVVQAFSKNGGLQLELSLALRQLLMRDPLAMQRFESAISRVVSRCMEK